MPKMKPHTGAGKRVRITGGGKGKKIVAEPAGKRHHLEVKSSRQTRRLTGLDVLSKNENKRIRKLLGR